MWNCSTICGTETRFQHLFHFLRSCSTFFGTLFHKLWNCSAKSGTVSLRVSHLGYCPCNLLASSHSLWESKSHTIYVLYRMDKWNNEQNFSHDVKWRSIFAHLKTFKIALCTWSTITVKVDFYQANCLCPQTPGAMKMSPYKLK